MLEGDWRYRGQDKWLAGKAFIRRPYSEYRPGCDHDHCEFCCKKFSLSNDYEQTGYSCDDNYHWVCDDCFQDFRGTFRWSVTEI